MSDAGPGLPQYTFAIANATGAVVRWGLVPSEGVDAIAVAAGETLVLAVELPDMTQGARLVEGQVVPRQAMPGTISKTTIAADGVDEAAFSGFPAGAEVFIYGIVSAPPTTLPDGAFVLTLRARGEAFVVISKPPEFGQRMVAIRGI